jgi:hypothetical protein
MKKSLVLSGIVLTANRDARMICRHLSSHVYGSGAETVNPEGSSRPTRQDCLPADSVAGDGCPVLIPSQPGTDSGPPGREFFALEPPACGRAGHPLSMPEGMTNTAGGLKAVNLRMDNRAKQSQLAVDAMAANCCSERRLGEKPADHAPAKTKPIFLLRL